MRMTKEELEDSEEDTDDKEEDIELGDNNESDGSIRNDWCIKLTVTKFFLEC